MSKFHQKRPGSHYSASFRTKFVRLGISRISTGDREDLYADGTGLFEGRRPGAGSPVYIETSPASVDPFPEPRTIPDGWDLSEMH